MKKRIYLVLLSIVLLEVTGILSLAAGETISGETVTGDATQTVGMNISVVVYYAVISIVSPKNEIYLTNESLLLDYTVTNQNTVWYNLDNGINTTLTSSVTFDTSQGSHTLYLYANNSLGDVTSANVSFTVNSTKITIVDNKYGTGGGGQGESTNFLNHTYEELQNLSEITLDAPEFGKIIFQEAINLTNDETPNDNSLNLDNNTNISFNRIEVNSTALPNFNKQAELWLYNLTFSDPRILKDGEVCSSPICIINEYSGGILSFNVTGFTVYSSEETPAEAVAPSGGSGGGGGTTAKKLSFEVEPQLIQVMIKKGELFKFNVKVKNTGASTRDFKMETVALKDFVMLTESEFSLKSGEERDVILIFSSPIELMEDTYTGKLKISSEGQEKEIPIALNIKSKIVLFDITLNVPLQYKEVEPGKEVLFQLSIFNLAGLGKEDVEINYYIKDFGGNTIDEQQGTLAVETQASLSRTLKIPEDTKEGQYVVGVNVKYGSSISTASDMFYIKKAKVSLDGALKTISLKLITYVLIVLLLIFTGIILVRIIYVRRKIKRISERHSTFYLPKD